MYDLTIFSIIRDAMGYIDRYEAQVREAFSRYNSCRLVLCEGDSVDGTKERLRNLDVGGKVDIITLDLGGPLYASVDIPERWTQLETCWNTCIAELEPTELAVCVESDLIWAADTLVKLGAYIKDGICDVVCPALMAVRPGIGLHWYDLNAFQKDGQHFFSHFPYHPALAGSPRFVILDTGGGMIVTNFDKLDRAQWRDKCVLHFEPEARIMLDTRQSILHP